MAHPQPQDYTHATWDIDALRKYDVTAPRYTSYPTANLFNESFSSENYFALADKDADSIEPLSFYAHIPFCKSICYYCGCNKMITRQRTPVREFLDALAIELEIKGKLHPHRPVTQLHWGGGTPTYLNQAELTELMHLIGTHFRLVDNQNREYSIEIDPRTVEPATIALLKGLGFNRISLGIQDFDPQVQQAINRLQSVSAVEKLVGAIRRHGFDSINFDLIYGLPRQNIASFENTMDEVIKLRPERLAIYNYAHMPQLFRNQRAIKTDELPDAETKLGILQYIGERLLDAGYLYIGMDHFVLPEDSLAKAALNGTLQRNFQGYSTCKAKDLVAVGPSAISQFKDTLFQNAKTLAGWSEQLNQQQLPIIKGLALSAEDKLRRQVIMDIACHLEVNFADIESQFGIDFGEHFQHSLQRLSHLEKDGLVTVGNQAITVTDRGRLLLRNICSAFDSYLDQGGQPGNFSRAL